MPTNPDNAQFMRINVTEDNDVVFLLVERLLFSPPRKNTNKTKQNVQSNGVIRRSTLIRTRMSRLSWFRPGHFEHGDAASSCEVEGGTVVDPGDLRVDAAAPAAHELLDHGVNLGHVVVDGDPAVGEVDRS